jgi:hypothetical protein
MRFTPDNVEVPDDLIQTLDRGKLVVFAGAGVIGAGAPGFAGSCLAAGGANGVKIS